MSHELIAILVVGITLGVGQVAAIVIAISGLGALVREMDRSFEETRSEMNRGFEELSRTHRVIAALIVPESDKIQALLRT
ncbi:MAG TPA: hypothetical protein VN754_12565 [Candidatus Binataceae bacterium]|nr:hypothetical protein [Candidatus Binataceae bacterium]